VCTQTLRRYPYPSEMAVERLKVGNDSAQCDLLSESKLGCKLDYA